MNARISSGALGDHADSPGPRRCGGRTKSGAPCGARMVLWTPDGWRCRQHRDLGPGRVRAPVRRLGSMEDAARLMSWCAVAVAEGRISQSQALALKASVSEWRQSFADTDTVRRYRLCLAVVEAVVRDERVLAAVNDARSDGKVRDALRTAMGGKP